jgi:integrase
LVAEIKRADGNNVAKRWLEVIIDLLLVALRASPPWIPVLPTYGLKVRPIQSDGHKEWPREAREQFEAYHPIGSAARTCYELAYWFGNRRSDITRVGPQHIVTEEVENSDGEIRTVRAFSFRQKKTDEKVFHPILPWVAEALAPALARGTQTILATEKGQPFSDKALTMRMQVWTRQAGLPEGLTVHGLRKTLGNRLAELGLSARQIQEVLGHRTLAAAQVYVDKANKKMLALDSFAVLEQRETKRRLRIVK